MYQARAGSEIRKLSSPDPIGGAKVAAGPEHLRGRVHIRVADGVGLSKMQSFSLPGIAWRISGSNSLSI